MFDLSEPNTRKQTREHVGRGNRKELLNRPVQKLVDEGYITEPQTADAAAMGTARSS
jgi:hypothetical protein